MYERWFPPELQRGKPLILVSFKREDLASRRVVGTVERLDPIEETVVTRDGVPMGRFFYRIAYGYSPAPGSRQ